MSGSSKASVGVAGVITEYCLAKPGAWPDQPWEGDTVAKVGPKIFAFLGSGGGSIGLKCGRDRDEADELIELIDASYDVVVARLPRKQRPVTD